MDTEQAAKLTEAFDRIAAEVARGLRGAKVHPRDVFGLAELVPADKRSDVVRALHKGTKLQAEDPGRDDRRVDPNVLINTADAKKLLEAAKPYMPPPPPPEPKAEAAPGTEA